MFIQLFDYVVNWSDDPLGKAHVYFAILALLLRAVLFLSRKGTTRHKTLGLTYFVSMLSINVSALMKYDFSGHVRCPLRTLLGSKSNLGALSKYAQQ